MIKQIIILFAVLLLWPLTVLSAEPYQEGVQYHRLDTPVPTQSSNKIEVAEAFWYGCPHCYRLEPTIEAWKRTLPDYASFRKVPAQFRPVWKSHGQLYFTIDALKLNPSVHEDVFNAIHKQGRKLATQEEMAKFVSRYGVKEAAFNKAYKSFGVRNQLRQADAVVRGSRINGVPALVVNGKYRISAQSAGGNAEMLKVAEYLIEKERAQK
ncbi:thiol:disulfide interchange protein DsbA/DsbL [Sansalvadorimonas verongulae]|uniref:thiol:disulfide interchange protein DsbA/DsbL n=1 Tax=Sansalvadorimonas verongulae TaxID=2172824 RepID=UPI002E31CC0B|nr:thiol:disulfide interchange protein DsbA/DsbL [Sansalvadorimonas verongulae]MTI12513.1 thiol:disulfide interchange protein DsbA/DsbL [Sansalvadorimonas verongulae]